MLAGFHDHAPPEESFREAVLAGLSTTPKSVPSKWIYDERGSRLFEAVCEAPEYYPTRTEVALLGAHADEIAALAGPDCALVEFGSGASHKVRLLLDALARPAVYVPVDIDGETLRRTAETIAADYPETAVVAVRADLTRPFPLPEAATRVSGARLGFFLGSTIGSFEADQARAFFGMCAEMLAGGGWSWGPTSGRTGRSSRPPTTTPTAPARASTSTCSTASTGSSTATWTRMHSVTARSTTGPVGA